MKKQKVVKKPLRVGDIKSVEFIKNHVSGKKPVCMIDGIVCFINRTYRGQFIQEHSVWQVEISQINERTMVVDPVQEVKTAFENKREIAQRLKELETKHPQKHVKPKVHYPYKSIRERRNSNAN